jgi:hypothetical protein
MDGPIQGLEVALAAEGDIGGEFHLHEAPVIGRREMVQHRAEALGPPIEAAVALSGIEAFGDGLGQTPSQPVVPIEIDLQTKRGPGRYPHITQPEHLVDKAAIVVQALAANGLQGGGMAQLVMPGAIGGASLHGREDVDPPRMLAPLGKDLLDAHLLSETLPACG